MYVNLMYSETQSLTQRLKWHFTCRNEFPDEIITTNLVVGRINTGWVVRTGVKDNDGTLGRTPQVFDHAVKIEAGRGLVPVAIFPDIFESRVLEDHAMISPEKIPKILK